MNVPSATEAIALLTWGFTLPLVIAMGWHCGKVLGAMFFGATKSSTDVKVSDITFRDNR